MVHIRRSERASRLAIRIRGGDPALELVVPPRVSLRAAQRFFEQYRGWAMSRLERLPHPIPFCPGNVVPVFGQPRVLRSDRDGCGHGIFAVTPTSIDIKGDLAFFARRAEDGLRKLAREILAAKVPAIAEQIQRKPRRISLSDPRSRWGSCSAGGDLRFSWRLIMAPEPVLDYVVAHEVAHLAHMDHSTRFWRLVQQLHPNFKDDRAWLRMNGAQLLRYGARLASDQGGDPLRDSERGGETRRFDAEEID